MHKRCFSSKELKIIHDSIIENRDHHHEKMNEMMLERDAEATQRGWSHEERRKYRQKEINKEADLVFDLNTILFMINNTLAEGKTLCMGEED